MFLFFGGEYDSRWHTVSRFVVADAAVRFHTTAIRVNFGSQFSTRAATLIMLQVLTMPDVAYHHATVA